MDNTETKYFSEKQLSAVVASNRQKGNPLLSHIRNVPVEFEDIHPDYLAGKLTAIVFISLTYHRLYPTYLDTRVATLGNRYRSRVLLCLVDLGDYETALKSVLFTAINRKLALLLAWSSEEAARYIETFKVLECKSTDALRGKLETTVDGRVSSMLTSVGRINKLDARAIMNNFSTVADIFKADVPAMQKCPGIGEKKVATMRGVFNDPFFSG